MSKMDCDVINIQHRIKYIDKEWDNTENNFLLYQINPFFLY